MKILGWEVSNTNVVISAVGAVLGGGACYAILKYLLRSRPNSTRRQKRRNCDRDGEHDLDLPLLLEQQYGNLKGLLIEDNPIAARYLQEFPDNFFQFNESFYKFITDFVTHHTKRYKQALIAGSGPGYLVFKLADIFDEVKGLEKSFSQVVICYQFQNLNKVQYNFPVEGALKHLSRNIESPLVISGPARTASERRKQNRKTIEFIHFDLGAENRLPSYVGEVQLIVLRNCLEDLDDPLSLLSTLKHSVELGGFLIISSDYLWKHKFDLPPGFSSQSTNSVDLFHSVLDDHFKLEKQKNIPEVICECARSSRVRLNDVTAWIRTDKPVSKPKSKSPHSHGHKV